MLIGVVERTEIRVLQSAVDARMGNADVREIGCVKKEDDCA